MTSTCIALLRAVNVAGHGMVAMADLRRFAAELGFVDVRTVLQSGNLVFGTDRKADAELERLLEREAAERLSLRTVLGELLEPHAQRRFVLGRNEVSAHTVLDHIR